MVHQKLHVRPYIMKTQKYKLENTVFYPTTQPCRSLECTSKKKYYFANHIIWAHESQPIFMPTKFLNNQPKPHPCCLSSLPRVYLSGCCRNYISKGIGSSHHKHFQDRSQAPGNTEKYTHLQKNKYFILSASVPAFRLSYSQYPQPSPSKPL